MPGLSEAALTTDFMELDESNDPAPPEQTEVAVTRDEGIVMEDKDVEPQDIPVPTSVPTPDYSPTDEQPPRPNQMTIGPGMTKTEFLTDSDSDSRFSTDSNR